MATVNFIKYKKQSAGALSGVTRYILQDEKTLDENGRQLVSGQNCTRHSWPTGSSRPPGPPAARTAPSGSTTTSSPFLRTR